MEFKDYYKTLGVAPTANADEIKKAYRKLARKYHPDVSKEPDAVTRMTALNEANAVLSDPEKRAAYDRYGHAGVDPNRGTTFGHHRTGMRGSSSPMVPAAVAHRAAPPMTTATFLTNCLAGVHTHAARAAPFGEGVGTPAQPTAAAAHDSHTSSPTPHAATTTMPALSSIWPMPTWAPSARSRCKVRTRQTTARSHATSAACRSKYPRACARASSSAWRARAALAGGVRRQAICFWRCFSNPTHAGAPRAAMSINR